MKKSFTTEAINLKNYPLNDNDSIVVMFSKTKGLIRAVAKGAKKPKSKLGARIQLFVANQLMLFEGKNLDTIAQAQSVNTFSKIRNSLDKLSYSMYIAQLVDTFCSKQFNTDENYEEIYSLIFLAYQKIAASTSKKDILFAILKFQIKFMSYLGWGLDLTHCSRCLREIEADSNNSALFSFDLKGFLCPQCTSSCLGDTIRIHNKIRVFLQELSTADFDKKTKYDEILTEQFLNKCFSFMKKYIDKLTSKRTKIFEILDKTTIAI